MYLYSAWVVAEAEAAASGRAAAGSRDAPGEAGAAHDAADGARRGGRTGCSQQGLQIQRA